MTLESELLEEQQTEGAANHIAWVARTLVAMGPKLASSMSTTQRVAPGEAEDVRKLLPALAGRYGLIARMHEEDGSITVTFERRTR